MTASPPSAAVPDPAANWASAYEAWDAVPREIVGHGRRLAFRAGWEAATERAEAAVPDPADVEKAARAIFDAANPIVAAGFPDYWGRVAGGEDTRDHYRRLAVAALAAARPSPDSEAVACAWCHERARGLAADGNDAMARLLASCGADGHGFDYAALGTGDREGGR